MDTYQLKSPDARRPMFRLDGINKFTTEVTVLMMARSVEEARAFKDDSYTTFPHCSCAP